MTRADEAHDVVAPFTWDLATGEMHWSLALYELCGLCPENDDAGVEALLAAVVSSERHGVREALTAGLRQGGPFSLRCRLQGGDGRPHEVLLTAVGARANGVTSYVTGFVVDVTAPLTARLDEAVAASAAHRAAIEQAKGVIMLGWAVSEAEAFGLLRAASNQHNVRLSVLAERVVQAVGSRANGRPSAFDEVVALLGHPDARIGGHAAPTSRPPRTGAGPGTPS